MKVCIVSHESELGPQMLQFAKGMVKRGIQTHAIIRGYRMPLREWIPGGDGISRHIAPVIPHPKLIFLSYFLSSTIIALFIRSSIIICRDPFTGLIGAFVKLVARRKNVIYVVDSSVDLKIERGLWKGTTLVTLGKLLEKLALRNSDLAIALDHSLIPFLKSRGARRIEVIPYGANRELFSRGNPEGVIRRLGLGDRRVVLYVGNMEEYHGAHHLAQAILLVRKQIPNTIAIFLGDGPLRKRMEDSLGDAGIFLGHVPYDELPNYLAASEVAVAPPAPVSPFVSVLTTKIFDYIAAGKAIVATDVGGIRRAFGPACIVVRPGDPAELANAIVKLLNDRWTRRQLEESATSLAMNSFNWDKLTERFAATIRDFQR